MSIKTILNVCCITVIVILFLSLWPSVLNLFVNNGDLKLYYPWETFDFISLYWGSEFYSKKITLSAMIAALMSSILGYMLLFQKSKNYHGNARYANWFDLYDKNMLAKKGVLLGQTRGFFNSGIGKQIIRSDLDKHALVVAPTDSGKTQAIIIPNALSWSDSAVILDMNKDVFNRTSKFRSMLGEVHFFAPTAIDGKTICFNPLDIIRRDKRAYVGDAGTIADILLPVSENSSVAQWDEWAVSLLHGLITYVIEDPQADETLGYIYRLLVTGKDFKQVLEYIVETRKDYLSETTILSFNEFIGKVEKERSGVHSNIVRVLKAWKDANVDLATSKSSFNIEDIRKKRMTIYLNFTLGETKKAEIKHFVRLILSCFTQVIEREIPDKTMPIKVLMFVDEFANWGSLPQIVSGLTTLRKFGVRIVNIVQDLSQLETVYSASQRKTIMQNSAYEIYFTTKDEDTIKRISNMGGEKTIAKKSFSSQHYKADGRSSISYTGVKLIRPEEVNLLDKSLCYIISEGMHVAKVRKLFWSNHKELKRRGDMGAIELEDIGELKQSKVNHDFSSLDDETYDPEEYDFETGEI